MSTVFENNNNSVSLEFEQNVMNKLTASSNRRFFASKVHKLKKMLKPVFKLMSTSRGGGESLQQQSSTVCCATSAVEDIQNAMNEALEARVSAKPYRYRDAAHLDIRLVAIRCDGTATRIPLHFVTSYVPSADNDICAQGDLYPISFYQEAEQQAPHACNHLY